jgi:uncharacterized delta-60 repeat protein
MKNIITITIAVFAFAYTTYAQIGSIDLTFNPTDVGYGDGLGANNTVWTTSIQSDGKIIIGGNFTSYNRITRNSIARLNANGILDTSFNPGTGANSIVYTTSIQSDGKIIIGGDFTSYNGAIRNYIARLNTDGTLDSSFNPGTGADSSVRTTSIQSDGKIIIAGSFASYNGASRNGLARLNVDGTIDNSFNPGTGANNTVNTTSIQSDGKIIIGGEFTSYNGTGRNGIARLNVDGTIDTSFNPGTGANNTVNTTSIQSDGKIIIGGGFTSYNGVAINRIARLNTNGTLDGTFNPGTGTNNTVLTTSIRSNGKIIIGGAFSTYNGMAQRNRIASLNTDGTYDNTFNSTITNLVGGNIVYTTSIQSNGRLIIGGNFGKNIARLNTNGTDDDSLESTTGVDYVGGNTNSPKVYTTSIQSDGKIIIGGEFNRYNGILISGIARLNTDGTLDTTFNPGTGPNNTVYATSIQSDGKIIIGGSFNSYNGTARSRIARLNVNGTLDTSFNPGTGANSTVYSTSIQGDGTIIIGGDFTSYNGTVRNRIARLNTDGTNSSFNSGTGANSTVHTTSIQSDGTIIIGGRFASYNGTTRRGIARLNANGTLNNSFSPGFGPNLNTVVQTTSIQSDGKIIVGGYFTSSNGTASYIARLNVDGTLDTSFTPGTGADNDVNTTSIQSDGTIIIGGKFTSYNGTTRKGIARLNANGTLNNSFSPGFGLYPVISTISVQSDGKIIVGGDFTSYNGTGRNSIARINGAVALSNPVFEKNAMVIYPNPTNSKVFFDNSNYNFKEVAVYNYLGQEIAKNSFSNSINNEEVDMSGLDTGIYILKFNNGKTNQSVKIVKQ